MDEKKILKDIVKEIRGMLGVGTEAHYSRTPMVCIDATIKEEDSTLLGFIPSKGGDILRVVVQFPFLPIRKKPRIEFTVWRLYYDHLREPIRKIIEKHARDIEVVEKR